MGQWWERNKDVIPESCAQNEVEDFKNEVEDLVPLHRPGNDNYIDKLYQ